METLAMPVLGGMGETKRKFYHLVPSLREFAI